MDAVRFFEEKARMTKFCQINCNDCPLSGMRNGRDMICRKFEISYPEEAIQIVEVWSHNNPQKTYLMDFLEKFPNCEKDRNGIPESCRKYIYPQTTKKDCYGIKCVDCWNEPMPEKGNLNG